MDAQQRKIEANRKKDEFDEKKSKARPSLLKRVASGLIDFAFAAIFAGGLFALTYFTIFPSVGYQDSAQFILDEYVDSGLFVYGSSGYEQLTSHYDANKTPEENYDVPVSKYYQTIVIGDLTKEMTITGSLLKDERKNRGRVSESGQSAHSEVRPLAHSADRRFTLAEVKLVTGRTHQIRVHLASKGFPLAGDSKYAVTKAGRAANERLKHYGVTTQLLHAGRLVFGDIPEEFTVLQDLKNKEIQAPLPAGFERAWEKLKGKIHNE